MQNPKTSKGEEVDILNDECGIAQSMEGDELKGMDSGVLEDC